MAAFSNINDVVQYILFKANKEQSGSISPNEINLALPIGQQEYFRRKLGLTEAYTVGQREAPEQFQATQSIDDSLRKFIVSVPLTKTGQGFNFPSDFAAWGNGDYLFVQQINGQNNATKIPVDFVTLAERAYRLSNYITFPTYEYPIGTYLNNQILIEPDGIDMITLSYVRYPVKPVWGYTIVNDEPVYDPATSVDFEFPNLDWDNIANISLEYYALFLRDSELFAATQQRIKNGLS